MNDALRDLASGRGRPFPRAPGDLKQGIVAGAILFALAVTYGVWHEKHEGPRHIHNVQTTLRQAGYPQAILRRDWINTCSRGSKGFVWSAPGGRGSACSYGASPWASFQVERGDLGAH
jgi:hypothetical protein